MPEVDYSKFYYKREDGQPLTEAEKERKISVGKERRKRGGNKKALLIVLVVLLCFGILFFSVDFFTNGYLIDTIATSFRGNQYEYYFVVCDKSVREMAYAQSLLIKQGGGSGYILSEKDKILVVYAQFTDRTEANTVAAKNPNTYVVEMGFSSKNTEVYALCDKAVGSLIEVGKKLETGAMTESDVLGVMHAVRQEAVALKTKIIDNGKSAEINLLELVIGSIDAMQITKSSRVEFLSDLRYALSGIIVSMKKTAQK